MPSVRPVVVARGPAATSCLSPSEVTCPATTTASTVVTAAAAIPVNVRPLETLEPVGSLASLASLASLTSLAAPAALTSLDPPDPLASLSVRHVPVAREVLSVASGAGVPGSPLAGAGMPAVRGAPVAPGPSKASV